jgi:hypothetical protein
MQATAHFSRVLPLIISVISRLAGVRLSIGIVLGQPPRQLRTRPPQAAHTFAIPNCRARGDPHATL